MNAVLPFAEQMLGAYGEFIPFGSVMRPDGEIVSVAGYDGNEHPRSVDVIALLKEEFVGGASKGEYLATAIVYDVRVKLSATQEKSDAIAVALDHRDGDSIIMFFPYKIDARKLTLGVAFAQKGDADIFASP